LRCAPDAQLSGSGGGAFRGPRSGSDERPRHGHQRASQRRPRRRIGRPQRWTGRPSRVHTRATGLLDGWLRAALSGVSSRVGCRSWVRRRSFGAAALVLTAVVAEPATASKKPLRARLSGPSAATRTGSTESDAPAGSPRRPSPENPDHEPVVGRSCGGGRSCVKARRARRVPRNAGSKQPAPAGGAIPMPAPPGNRLPTPARPSMRRCLRRRPRASRCAS
jgi:hypothetical protein